MTKPRKWLWLVIILALVIGLVIWLFSIQQTSAPGHKTEPAPPTPKPVAFNKSQLSTTDPTSLWVIVNKSHPLNPKNYVPADLVTAGIPLRSNITATEKQVSERLNKELVNMVTAAKVEGVELNLQSGYRSYNFQINLYDYYVSNDGQSKADTYSARPGYSEHQTGLAVDLGGTSQPSCNVELCFADTTEGKWLAANAYKYGFIIRYPAGFEQITGYQYEPWHLRYVGTDLALEMHKQKVMTLEQFFGVSGGNYQ